MAFNPQIYGLKAIHLPDQFSFFISPLKQDAMLTANPQIPVHKNIAAIPLPALFPTMAPKIPASPFPAAIKGSKT